MYSNCVFNVMPRSDMDDAWMSNKHVLNLSADSRRVATDKNVKPAVMHIEE
jgi:hypothetical protein